MHRKITAFFCLLLILLQFSCSTSLKETRNTVVSGSKKTLLLYYSFYGTTKETSQWVADGIGGDVDVLPINDFNKIDITNYEVVVLGTAIYMENVALQMQDFLQENRDKFKEKPIAIFIVAGSYLISGERYLNLFETDLGQKPIATAYFGGRMFPEMLNEFHLNIMKKYWADRGQDVQTFDFRDKDDAISFGKKIKELTAKGMIK